MSKWERNHAKLRMSRRRRQQVRSAGISTTLYCPKCGFGLKEKQSEDRHLAYSPYTNELVCELCGYRRGVNE